LKLVLFPSSRKLGNQKKFGESFEVIKMVTDGLLVGQRPFSVQDTTFPSNSCILLCHNNGF
jgi:hypothetical protein